MKHCNCAGTKPRFCERNYLDERTLHEIVRIREQLELIVSDLGVPIGSGGAIADYICAVSRGLIQFVCARQGRGMFRSLTAERIQIHPGSVMFRQDADFIVAGEIVRTTRMYAMSVSPLSKAQLYRISPELADQLIRLRQRTSMPPRSRERDAYRSRNHKESQRGGRKSEISSHDLPQKEKLESLVLGGEVFPIEGKKPSLRTVVLDWNRLKRIASQMGPADEDLGKGLKAKIEWGKYQLFGNEKFSTVLKALKWMDIEKDLSSGWPKHKNYSFEADKSESEEDSLEKEGAPLRSSQIPLAQSCMSQR
jgi:Domain of unknown function (DUF1605).